MRHIYKKGHQRVLMVATIIGQRTQRQPKECQGRQGFLRTPKGAFVLGENDFKKSFSPKPACLVATENKIFRKSSSC